MNELQDEFDNDDINHFTHYDYLCQVIDNGQKTAFKDHLKTMSNKALVDFLKVKPLDMVSTEWTKEEILKRMN